MAKYFIQATLCIMTMCVAAGCTTPAPVLLDGSLSSFKSADEAVPTSATWWAELSDASLNHLVDQALAHNFSLKAAALRLSEANSAEDAAIWSLAPKVGVDLKAANTGTKSYRTNNPFSAPKRGLAGDVTGTFSVSWELPLFGKAQAVSAQGAAESAQNYWRLEAARIALVSELVRTYAHWQSVSQAVKVTEDSQVFLEELLSAEEITEQEGISSASTVAKVKMEVLAGQRQLYSLTNQKTQLENRIAALVGLPEKPLLPQVSVTSLLLKAPLITNVQASQLRRRPDIRVAEEAVAIAAAQLGVARANLWPQFSFTGGMTASRGVLDSTGFTKGTSNVVNFSTGLHIPLLDWFALKAEANVKANEMAAVVQDYRQTILSAWEESGNAYGDYLTAENRSKTVFEQKEIGLKDVWRQEELYRQGVGTKQEILRAKLALNEKIVAHADENFAVVESWAKLVKATYISN